MKKSKPSFDKLPFMSLFDYRGNSVYSLNRLDFTSKGVDYIVIATEVTGSKIYDVRHKIKNTVTGNSNWVTMISLVNMFKEGVIDNGIKEKAILS